MPKSAFFQGTKDAFPIALGYVPVAIAFGMATTSAGFPIWLTVAMSLLIYAGASQFLLFASIMSGASVAGVVALCALLDSRHLLYGPLLKRHLKPKQNALWVSPLITDEVFATAMTKPDTITHQTAWLWGIALVSWVSWWGGTIVGVYGGKALSAYPTMVATMNFAFVALFVALSTSLFLKEPRFRVSLIIAGITAILCTLFGNQELALFVAGIMGMISQIIIQKFKK